MLAFFIVFGPWVFKTLFKESWEGVIPILAILMLMFAMKMIASPISFSFYIVDRLVFDLFGHILFVTCIIISIFVGFILGNHIYIHL